MDGWWEDINWEYEKVFALVDIDIYYYWMFHDTLSVPLTVEKHTISCKATTIDFHSLTGACTGLFLEVYKPFINSVENYKTLTFFKIDFLLKVILLF